MIEIILALAGFVIGGVGTYFIIKSNNLSKSNNII